MSRVRPNTFLMLGSSSTSSTSWCWDGILAYFDTQLISAAIEAVNGNIQLATPMARGFNNFVYFRTAAYHRAGKLQLAVPAMT